MYFRKLNNIIYFHFKVYFASILLFVGFKTNENEKFYNYICFLEALSYSYAILYNNIS